MKVGGKGSTRFENAFNKQGNVKNSKPVAMDTYSTKNPEITQDDNEDLLKKDNIPLDIIFKLEKSVREDSTGYESKQEIGKDSTRSDLKQEVLDKKILFKPDCELYEFIYSMIKHDEFELGYENETIRYIQLEVNKNRDTAMKALQQVLLKHSKEKEIWIAVIHILTALSYEDSEPYSVYMAASFLANKDIEIKEMAVNIFEQWSNHEAIEFLESMETGVVWLDKYIETVINDISMGCK